MAQCAAAIEAATPQTFLDAIYMERHFDNFAFMRITAAALVILSHVSTLLGKGPYLGTLGLTGVVIFFAISGYLVTLSWDRDPSPYRFMYRRALRVLPGLIVSVAVCALVVGPIFTASPLIDYFSDPAFIAFCKNIFLFPINSSLPGMFLSNPLKFIVNGPLWTLPMEIAMYVSLVLLATLSMWGRKQIAFWLAAALISSVFCLQLWPNVGTSPKFLTMNFLQLLFSATAFCAGALMARLPKSVLCWWAFIPVTALIAMRNHHTYVAIWIIIFVPYAAISLASKSTPYLRKADRFGDPSYGVYIYSFPIQQMLVHSFPDMEIYTFIALSLTLPYIAGLASWHLIEKQALIFKPKRKPVKKVAIVQSADQA